MKPYSLPELKTFIDTTNQVLVEAQLQEVLANDRGLALGFQKSGYHYWLLLDLIQASPQVLLFQNQCPFQKVTKGKPVSLFLKSHAKNLGYQSAFLLEGQGRVFVFVFAGQNKKCEVEVRLIPKQANLIVRAEGKSISWAKPKDLSETPIVEVYPESRSFEQIHQEWLAEQKMGDRPAQDPQVQWEKKRQRDLEKKRKAVLEIEKQLNDDKGAQWFDFGEALKMSGPQNWLELKESWGPFLDSKKNYSWNLENAFSKAKQIMAKRQGTESRLHIVQEEIANLERAVFSAKIEAAKQNTHKKSKDLMQAAEAKGRTLRLASGAVAYVGKSAADNLALLRSARAWDFWLHLRDYPGAHAIIHREKGQELPLDELKKVAIWVAKESLSKKSLLLGQRLNVAVAECRFVRPIKGDKLGRVNFHSEKNFVCHLDS